MLSQHSPEVFSKLNIKTYLSEWTYYSTANFTAKLTFVRGSLFSMFINKIIYLAFLEVLLWEESYLTSSHPYFHKYFHSIESFIPISNFHLDWYIRVLQRNRTNGKEININRHSYIDKHPYIIYVYTLGLAKNGHSVFL